MFLPFLLWLASCILEIQLEPSSVEAIALINRPSQSDNVHRNPGQGFICPGY